MTIFTPTVDSEALVGYALRSANIPDIGARWYSTIPAKPTYALGTVTRIGGVPVDRHRLDRANIQIDVWGNRKSEAFDIANAARVVIHEMEATTFTVAGGAPVDGFVAGVEDSLGFNFSVDPESKHDRFTFAVLLYSHGLD